LFGALFSTVFLGSCKSDRDLFPQPLAQNPVPKIDLKEARDWYREERGKITGNLIEDSTQLVDGPFLFWRHALNSFSSSGEEFVVVPMLNKSTDHRLKTRLLMKRDSTGAYIGAFVLYNATDAYHQQTNGDYNTNDFSGDIIYTDLTGKFMFGYHSENGVITGNVLASASAVSGTSSNTIRPTNRCGYRIKFRYIIACDNGGDDGGDGRGGDGRGHHPLKPGQQQCYKDVVIYLPCAGGGVSSIGYSTYGSGSQGSSWGDPGTSGGGGQSYGNLIGGRVPTDLLDDNPLDMQHARFVLSGLFTEEQWSNHFIFNEDFRNIVDGLLAQDVEAARSIAYALQNNALDANLIQEHAKLMNTDAAYLLANKQANFPEVGTEAWMDATWTMAEGWGNLNQEEKRLARENKREFLTFASTAKEALDETKIFVERVLGGSDARTTRDATPGNDRDRFNCYQHGLWNALMTLRMGEARAKTWADAHEWTSEPITKSDFLLPSQMDFFNNAVGRTMADLWRNGVTSGSINLNLFQFLEQQLNFGVFQYICFNSYTENPTTIASGTRYAGQRFVFSNQNCN
jgi:hypothetical protein